MTSYETLLQTYPNAKVVKVTQELDDIAYAAQKSKYEKRQAEGGAIGVVWLDRTTVVLANRTGTDLHPGWALLGGTVEKGQKFDEAFVREVKEESGIVLNAAHMNLLLVEEKTFVSPFGETLAMRVAVFEATAPRGQEILRTSEAAMEGLEVKAFALTELPEQMILKDKEKLYMAVAAFASR